MMHAPAPHVELSGGLHRARARWTRHAALRAAAHILATAAILLLSAGLAERALSLYDASVLALAIVVAVGVTAATVVFAWPLRHRPDDRRVARFVEERYPECGDALVTAVDLSQSDRRDRDFAPLVIASAAERMAALDLDDVVAPAAARRVRRRAAGSLVAAIAAVLVAWPFLTRAFEAGYVHVFPASVRLAVTPGDLRIAAGRPATIVAKLTGRAGALSRIAAQVTLDASGQTVTVAMERTAEGYRFQVPRVERSFHYMVSAGPAVSRAYSVTALNPSRVARIDLQYDFPSFTGLKPRLDTDSGDVYAPAGTRVRVVVHADKPVRDGALAFSQGRPPAPLARVDDRTLAASLTVQDEGAYRVGLVDADGLRSESVEYFVRVMDDRPPEVHIMRPGGDEPITPLQEVPIEVRANDDFGVQKMDLVYSVAGGAEQVVPFTAFSGTELARVGTRMLAVEDLKVRPGDVIAYYARAWDVARAKRSTMATSEIFFLEVKPFNEEFQLAQSQAGMQAATATQLDGLISAQKEIISATWNLERRASAGTSATDVKGIADAQIELKGRAERAAGAQQQRRRFGGFLKPAQTSPRAQSSGEDPVQQAVVAMGKAAQELQGMKTSGAIPHEMAALNALLRAQAEIRRQQVTQQQSNGGGGFGNRQTVDLSSLFDRELKRQQKTNYENKSEAETTPETQAQESALDKIRDLARRQEELSRRQQELAKGNLPEDEAKRQLEKLTREQEALRRQLEEASRQRGAEGAQGARGAQGAQDDVQRALQQMRDAAAQGQQSDASGAAAKAQQAADALRRAEAQMQNGSPDAQKRALGDLQLESQQVAQEQRRIADEAERLDREAGGTGDARRRLASDKDRLADRVDALQRSAQRLPSAAEAARDLTSQQLGDRMRATAQQLRDGKSGGKAAPSEQQMADALDRIARKLGANDAGGAKRDAARDTARLSGDLDAVRDARERIARLERQLREAQGARGAQGAQGAKGAKGARGPQGAPGAEGAAGDVARLQQQLNDEMQRTRDLLQRLQRGTPQTGGGAATPEEHEWSRSAPGTEAFKQDYGGWQSLAADISRALERAESSAASRLSAALARDRLRAGGSDRVPDAYRRQVSKYFESIAIKK